MSDEQLRRDELVSAYLDGEASPAEIAEVEQDDTLMARVEQLRSVRDAVAAPVAPVPEELRDRMIGAALAAAEAETAQRREARIVPIHRRRETLLAVAAAAVLLAAVVSAGLIASRGSDDSDEMAAAPTESADAGTAAAADEAAPMAEEEPMAEEAAPAATTTAPYVEMPDEEPMAELEADMDDAGEAAAVEPEAAMAEAAAEPAAAAAESAEAEAAMAAPAEETADAPATSANEAGQKGEEERRTADDAPRQVVDLGPFESLQSLFDNIAARWSGALEDGTTADSGTCSAAVHERALALDVETAQPFVAAVGAEDLLILDARFARRADGTAIIIYAAPPDCGIEVRELPG